MGEPDYQSMIDHLVAKKVAIQTEAQAQITKIDRAIDVMQELLGDTNQTGHSTANEKRASRTTQGDMTEDRQSDADSQSPRRPKGLKWTAEQIIRKRGTEMSVENLKGIMIDAKLVDDKDTLYNSLYSAMSKDDRFRKTSPGTFIMADMTGGGTTANANDQ